MVGTAGTPAPGDGPGAPPDPRRWFVLAVALTSTFLVIGGVSVVNLAIPSMQQSLHAGFGRISVVIAAYSLVYAIFLITGGRLGDLFGQKRILLLGLALFTVAVLAGGLAPGVTTLSLARVVQGFGAALIYPQILAVIEETFEGSERTFALGLFGATIGVALVAGQLVGGVLIEFDVAGLGWRAAMLFLVPVGLLALVAGWLVMRDDPARRERAHLDYGGTALLALALVLLLVPLIGGRDAHWPLWMLAMLVAALPALAAFIRFEQRVVARGGVPLLRPSLFRQRSFSIGAAIGVGFFTANLGFAVYTSVMFQGGQGFGPLQAGLAFAPAGVAFFAASLLAPHLVARLGRSVLVLGYGLLALGMAAVAVSIAAEGPRLGVWSLAPALLLVGAGQGLGMSPLVGAVLSGIRHEDTGSAAGALTTSFQIGQTLGVAVIGMIFFPIATRAAGRGPAGSYLVAYQWSVGVMALLAVGLLLLVLLLPRPEPAVRADALLERPQSRRVGLAHAFYLATGGHGGPALMHRILRHHQHDHAPRRPGHHRGLDPAMRSDLGPVPLAGAED